MKIDIKNEQGITHIDLMGRLDTTTSPVLQSELEDYYNKEGFHIVLNFAGLEFISSAGLRVMLLTQKKAKELKGEMLIQNVNPEIMEVFEMTGFSDILTIV